MTTIDDRALNQMKIDLLLEMDRAANDETERVRELESIRINRLHAAVEAAEEPAIRRFLTGIIPMPDSPQAHAQYRIPGHRTIHRVWLCLNNDDRDLLCWVPEPDTAAGLTFWHVGQHHYLTLAEALVAADPEVTPSLSGYADTLNRS